MTALPTTRVPRRAAIVAGAVALAAAVPLLFLGPGTDLDVGAVIASGRLIMRGHYKPSRPPGAPVHEALVGLLERIGGVTLSNVASLAAAVLVVAAIVALARREGIARPLIVAAIVVVNPWFFVAATSTVDFPFALAFLLWGVIALRRDRAVVAGVLFALAVGCRATTALLVIAAVLADAYGDRSRLRRGGVALGLAAVLGVAAYIPGFVSAGGSLSFAQNDFRTASPGVMLGRAAAKDLYFIGPFAAIVVIVALPALVRALRGWRTSWVVRFSVLGAVVVEAMFVRFPWKMGHLLPLLVCLALLAGYALRDRPRLLLLLVAAQLLYAFVNVQLLEPDNPNDATGARAVLDLRWGVVVTDTACRADDTGAWQGNDKARLEAVWNCAKPFGTGP